MTRDVLLVLVKDRDWSEYQVKVYIDGQFQEGPTSHHDDLEDALDTLLYSYKYYNDKGCNVKVSRNRYTRDLAVIFKLK